MWWRCECPVQPTQRTVGHWRERAGAGHALVPGRCGMPRQGAGGTVPDPIRDLFRRCRRSRSKSGAARHGGPSRSPPPPPSASAGAKGGRPLARWGVPRLGSGQGQQPKRAFPAAHRDDARTSWCRGKDPGRPTRPYQVRSRRSCTTSASQLWPAIWNRRSIDRPSVSMISRANSPWGRGMSQGRRPLFLLPSMLSAT